MGRLEHCPGEGLGRVHPVPAEGGVDRPAPDHRRLEPVDEVAGSGAVPTFRFQLAVEGGQHAPPGWQGHPCASVQSPQDALDPPPLGACQGLSALVEQVLERARQGQERRFDRGQGGGGRPRRRDHLRKGRPGRTGRVRRVASGPELDPHGRQKALERTLGPCAVGTGDPPAPAFGGKLACGVDHRLQGLTSGPICTGQVAHPRLQPPTASAPPLRAPDPAPQLHGLLAGKGRGKGRVRRIEQMMSLVEDHPAQVGRLRILGRAPP